MPLNHPLFRPPAEADSLILQVDQGCPYNRCTFCGMYRRLPYQRRTLPEIQRMIASAARQAPETRVSFLPMATSCAAPFRNCGLSCSF